MHSASIDVGKILSDEVDDRTWAAYLKGDRGVFTRRASRLIGGAEAKGIAAHYETDPRIPRIWSIATSMTLRRCCVASMLSVTAGRWR